MDCFSNPVQEALRCYVYCLIDPRDNKIFYVGKGTGNRVFAHAADAIKSDKESLKLNVIRDIHRAGLSVKNYIIRHNLTDEEAFLVESALIDTLTFPQFNMEKVLTNIAAGHHQWDEGIKTVEELSTLYDCTPIATSEEDRILLVSLNKSFDQAKANGVYRRINIYDATRRYWHISASRAASIKYVLGIYKGVVRSVVEVNSYNWVRQADDGTMFKTQRCCFEGQLLKDSPFLNKDVSAYPFGSGGSIRYLT